MVEERFNLRLAQGQKASPSGENISIEEKGVSGKDPFGGSSMLRKWRTYLDEFDPEAVSLAKLLKMRRDPAIALGLHMIAAPLIRATWDIICADPLKRAFVKAAMQEVYLEMMLYSLSSIALGFAAVTKQFEFRVPESPDGETTWSRSDVKPVIIKKLKQLDPETVKPKVENDEFKGIIQFGKSDEPIDPMYCLWITHAKEEAFGNLYGWALPRNVYHLWWSRNYRYALKDRHIEDRVSPPVVVEHPSGYVEDETTGEKIWFRDAAIEVGKAIRSGETVAISSEPYANEMGESKSVRKWGVKYLLGGANVEAFVKLDDQDDVRTLMGLLIPPQSLLSARGGLGSQAVAETLGEMFWISQAIRKDALDLQINKYVVEQLDRLNFPAGTPKAKLVTTGFEKKDIELMDSVIKILAGRQDFQELVDVFDVRAAMRERGLPVKEVQSGQA
jgi:hypothetical protein